MSKFRSPQEVEQVRIPLVLEGSKRIELNFDGGQVSSDGGLLLLARANNRLRLSQLAKWAIVDKRRRTGSVSHEIESMLKQRVFAIAAGYEDGNDAIKLRKDAMHKLAVTGAVKEALDLASQPTLSRFEAMADAATNDALQKLYVPLFVGRFKKPPKLVRLALDTTCDEVHGYQQLSLYNTFYGTYCYAPLFIFTDCGFPLCALLRPGSPSPLADAMRMLKRVISDLRMFWPAVKIEVTADAAFASGKMFEFLEDHKVTYFIAAAGHSGFQCESQELVQACKATFDEFGEQSPELKKYGAMENPKERLKVWKKNEQRIRGLSKEEGRMQEHFEDDLHFRVRRFGEFEYLSGEWNKSRRVIFRVEVSKEGPDVRFVVTNSKTGTSRKLYEEKYCRRARCENWIKDLKNYLKCDRTSCQEFKTNQFRLHLHTFAYILIWEVRRAAKLQEMTVETFRLQFLKIGVIVKECSRKIKLHMASLFVWQEQFRIAWLNL